MTILTDIFPNGFSLSDIPTQRPPLEPEAQLRVAISDAGLTPPEHIIFDGKIHRFSTSGKRNDDSGWYVAYDGKIAAGAFGDWRQGLEVTWRADIGRDLSAVEHMQHAARMREMKAQREREMAVMRQEAAENAAVLWESARLASDDHPYLQKKGIANPGLRVGTDGRLIAPMYFEGNLVSLQHIDADGNKKMLKGGKAGGAWWSIGSALSKDCSRVYLAEGVATAASIFEATAKPVAIAYSAGNLAAVAKSLREIVGPGCEIVIVADNDESGTGQRESEKAAQMVGASVIMPPTRGDANDYAQAGNDLAGLLLPNKTVSVVEKLKTVFGDQLSPEYEAPDELVEGLMTIGSTVVIYGDSNSGKTFFALSMAAAIAEGVLCYGRKTDPGLVIYLASEAPASIRSRMQAIKKYHGYTLENLAMVPVPMNFYSGEGDANDVIELVREVERIKGKPCRVIFGDTLARMSAGANENSGEDMGPVMARFDRVAAVTKAAMGIIHHNGKDAAKGARGWSGIRAHIDTEIEVVEKDGIRSATITKQRELPGKGESIYFKLEIVEMGITKFGGVATTCVAISDDTAEENKPHQKPPKHIEYARTLERAWWASGAEIRDDAPYISRSALRELLIKDGMSERTAKNKTEAGRADGMIAPLLNGGVIESHEHGWVFVNEAQISAMLLRKG
jgi:putative DNA primase/helicase